MYSCLFLNTFYGAFLKSHYDKNQGLIDKPYDRQKASIMGECFGDSDFYSQGLRNNGWNADDIIVNCPPLQKTWAKENKASETLAGILMDQIRRMKPDVVYVQDMNFLGNQILRHIKAETQLLVANTGSPVGPSVDVRLFDMIFSCDPLSVMQFKGLGVASYYQNLAFDPRILEKSAGRNGNKYAVTFVGGLSQLHGRRRKFLESLSRFIEIDCWGYGRESLATGSPLLDRHHGEVWGLDMFSVLKQSLMTINMDVSMEFGGNMRVFEATGCGTLLLTDYLPNLGVLFDLGKEIVAYRSPEECAALIKYFLNNEKEADEIAKAGQARTLRDYTYSKLMARESEILKHHLEVKRESRSRRNTDLLKPLPGDALTQPGKIPKKTGGRSQTIMRESVSESPAIRSSGTLGGIGVEKFHIERFGDQDCGWSVIPGLLGKESVIYCVGCGDNISFDLGLMNNLGCRIHAFDPTPKSLAFLRSLDLPEEYDIFDYGLSHFDGLARFNPPVNPEHVSHTICERPMTSDRSFTVPMKRLETIMQELGHDRIDLLKIDIEGAEYGVIEDLVKNKIPVGQLCVEFHHFLDGNKLESTFRAIIRLIQGGYLLHSVHKHTDYCFVWKPLVKIFPEGKDVAAI